MPVSQMQVTVVKESFSLIFKDRISLRHHTNAICILWISYNEYDSHTKSSKTNQIWKNEYYSPNKAMQYPDNSHDLHFIPM